MHKNFFGYVGWGSGVETRREGKDLQLEARASEKAPECERAWRGYWGKGGWLSSWGQLRLHQKIALPLWSLRDDSHYCI